jgi:hypothetical protein
MSSSLTENTLRMHYNDELLKLLRSITALYFVTPLDIDIVCSQNRAIRLSNCTT